MLKFWLYEGGSELNGEPILFRTGKRICESFNYSTISKPNRPVNKTS